MPLYNPDPGPASENPLPLSPDHRRMLFEESGISPEIAAGRGYWTATRHSELVGLKGYQRRVPALVVPTHSPDGETTAMQLRPDHPRVQDGKAIKYETPADSRCILDVHPSNARAVRDASRRLWITEGVKKGDALAGRGECVISLVGVWNWQRGGGLLPCWEHVALRGREVLVVFDSDVMAKEGVQLALKRLVGALEERGADVRVVYLPAGEDGSKVGVDDYLVAGGTVAELRALARRFEPQDLGRIRLSRDEKLQAAVEDLRRRHFAEKWKGLGGYSDRSVAERLMEAARRNGKVVEGGIRVVKSWGALQLEVGCSRRTLSKAIRRLEERGFCRRDNEGRKADKAGAFVLRAGVDHYGESSAGEGKETRRLRASASGGLHLRASVHEHLLRGGEVGDSVRVLPIPAHPPGGWRPRAPRLRWSSPARRPRLGTVTGTTKVRQGPRDRTRPAIKRLGKKREALLDAIDELGGQATLGEIAASLHIKRPCDLARRKDPESRKGRDGDLVMLEEAGILTVEDDLVTLADNWLEALDAARELGGEIAAEEAARRDLARKRRAYHGRHRVRPDHHPANAGADGWCEDLDVLPEPPGQEGLYRMMYGKIPVGTPRGPGLLWQVFDDRVGVVLDAEPQRVSFFQPCELVVEEMAL